MNTPFLVANAYILSRGGRARLTTGFDSMKPGRNLFARHPTHATPCCFPISTKQFYCEKITLTSSHESQWIRLGQKRTSLRRFSGLRHRLRRELAPFAHRYRHILGRRSTARGVKLFSDPCCRAGGTSRARTGARCVHQIQEVISGDGLGGVSGQRKMRGLRQRGSILLAGWDPVPGNPSREAAGTRWARHSRQYSRCLPELSPRTTLRSTRRYVPAGDDFPSRAFKILLISSCSRMLLLSRKPRGRACPGHPRLFCNAPPSARRGWPGQARPRGGEFALRASPSASGKRLSWCLLAFTGPALRGGMHPCLIVPHRGSP